MITYRKQSLLFTFLFTALASGAPVGCAGKAAEETVEAQPKDEGEGESAAEAPAAEADVPHQAPGEATALTATAPTPVGSPAATPEAVPAPQSAPAVAPDGKGRVVRYVSSKEAAVHSGPSDNASQVGSLARGERVMVVEENGWGRITDSMYVKLKALSAKAIPRKREPAMWGKPAH